MSQQRPTCCSSPRQMCWNLFGRGSWRLLPAYCSLSLTSGKMPAQHRNCLGRLGASVSECSLQSGGKLARVQLFIREAQLLQSGGERAEVGIGLRPSARVGFSTSGAPPRCCCGLAVEHHLTTVRSNAGPEDLRDAHEQVVIKERSASRSLLGSWENALPDQPAEMGWVHVYGGRIT